ncbi:MAG TPA: hypothetical protein VNI61_11750 [Gemmatimonadales bacterium]|nr:hypothetical protein [Gemmatimonadales bacterium]
MSRVLRAVSILAGAVVVFGACRERVRAVQGAADLRALVRQRIGPVERATGLTFKREPVVEQRTRAQMKAYVIRKLDEELPPAEFAGMAAAYRLLGLLPEALDLRRTLVDLLTEQVAGYYEPDSGALYVAADLGGLDSFVVRTTVSHELVHALQDQYADLDSIMSVKRQNDRRLAAQAVLEGQATLAQTLVMMPEQDLTRLPSFWESRSVVRRQQAVMPQFAAAPLWLREVLIFPYLGGADFVRAFRLRHPGRQPLGDAMPVSTEQILHADRYAAGDAPTGLAFEAEAGRRALYEDGLGEFEIRVLFMVLLGDSLESEAPRLAAGWDGDRYLVLDAGSGGSQGSHAFVWYSVWDSEADAREFAEGLHRAWMRRPAVPAGRRYEIWIGEVEGMPAVRLVDAPEAWGGWRAVPGVRVVR